jgi:hypothetical protein
MSTMNKAQHPIVAMLLPRAVPALITYAEQVVQKMTANLSFPAPTPTLASVTQAIDDLRAAAATALTRAKGTAAARNDKRTTLAKLLKQLGGYIQTIADANAETGATIIQSAGVAVKKVTARKPRVFEATQGPISGSAKLTAVSAGHRGAYEWQYSTDGGKTWLATPTTLQAKTVVSGLTAGSTVMFRYRAVIKSGEGDWSQVVSLIVK